MTLPRNTSARFRALLGILLLAFGLLSSGLLWGGDSPKWVVLSLTLYSLPFLMQFMRFRALAIYATWGGVFLVFQTFVSFLPPSSRRHDFKTLVQNLNFRLNVVEGITGVRGIQYITTDAHGFRVKPPVDYRGTSDALRIVAIGGSTTADGLLDDKATWTHILQEQLATALQRNVEIINTGVSGLRAKHHLATLEHVLKFRPEVAIFLVGVNDWNRQVVEYYNPNAYVAPWYSRYLFTSTLLGEFIDRTYQGTLNRYLFGSGADTTGSGPYFTGGLVENHGTMLASVKGALARPDVRSLRIDAVATDYRRVLETISNRCHGAQILCVFLTQPNGYSLEASDAFREFFWMTPPYASYTLDLASMAHVARTYNQFLLDFAQSHGHPAIDVAASLEPTLDNFYDDVHFNTLGAQRFADRVAEDLGPILQRR